MRRRSAALTALLLAGMLAGSWPEAAATPATGRVPAAAVAAQAPAAPADFNGDGTADLVVGAPMEGVGGAGGAGAVQVLYGAAGGPPAGGGRLLTQANPEPGDRFGQALAVGDFDGDGFGDLAAGAPGEDVAGAADAGAVNLFAGSPGGLQGGSRTLLQANPEARDRFGAALAASLFDIGDGTADLAVGAPGEDAASPAFPGQPSRPLTDTGAVTVFYGSAGGLAGAGQVLLPIGRQAGDALGSALAPVLDERSDPSSYLAAGGPGADLANARDAGKVEIFVRRTSRLSSTSFTRQQGDNGIPGALEAGDRFGAALAAGPLHGPIAGLAEADLAVGAPGEDVGSLADAGTVTVLEGAPDPDPRATVLYQGRAGIPGAAEAGDRFGSSLAVGPLDGGQEHDLAVGAPGEDVGPDADAGAVTVVLGTPGGLTSAGSRLLVQANPEDGDRLGAAVAAGDLDGDGVAELAAGAPGENVDRAVDAGAVELFDGVVRRLLHQGLLGSRPESGDAFAAAVVAG